LNTAEAYDGGKEETMPFNSCYIQSEMQPIELTGLKDVYFLHKKAGKWDTVGILAKLNAHSRRKPNGIPG
jgi:hypothetical protein